MQLGPYKLRNRLFVAPMAGVTDQPFRRLCKRMGAGMAVSEMISARPELLRTRKSIRRMTHAGEPEPRAVQIAGADPDMMAEAARYNVAQGAQIIDINMGCPAKKVCNVMAGSALMKDEALVARILEAVVRAVEVPVTLKTRTGWDRDNRNAPRIARIAQEAGIQALAIHGRSRACAFQGMAEYDTIAEVKARLSIPVIANGDIATPEQARAVLDYTKADAIMIGRAAQGRPWIFGEIQHYLETGTKSAQLTPAQVHQIMVGHLHELYEFYGEFMGVQIARKHIAWYCKALADAEQFRQRVNLAASAGEQLRIVDDYFAALVAADIDQPKEPNLRRLSSHETQRGKSFAMHTQDDHRVSESARWREIGADL